MIRHVALHHLDMDRRDETWSASEVTGYVPTGGREGIGRGMKVGKEEIIALIVALERYLKLDHEKEIEEWNAKARRLASRLQGIRGLDAEYAINTKGYADVDLSWDEHVIRLTHDELRRRLLEGSPRIAYDGTTVRVAPCNVLATCMVGNPRRSAGVPTAVSRAASRACPARGAARPRSRGSGRS